MGTHDDFFVRNDVTLLKEEGWDKEALKEELADKVKEELASDLKVEVEQLFDSGKVNLPAGGEREDLWKVREFSVQTLAQSQIWF